MKSAERKNQTRRPSSLLRCIINGGRPERRKRRRRRRTDPASVTTAFLMSVLILLPSGTRLVLGWPDRSKDDRKKSDEKNTKMALKRNVLSPSAPSIRKQNKEGKEFLEWCKNVLGIYTILEIETFEYYDYMKAIPGGEDWEDFEENGDNRISVDSLPMIPVRGLVAARDIKEGEIVIRIPLQALLSVATTIDQDPVLSRVMGPESRKAHGWVSDAQEEGSFLDVPLLAIALLHHRKLGAASPLSPYLDMLKNTSTDSMPFLWSKERLKAEVAEGIRTVARSVRQEMEDMYTTIAKPLIDEHPDLFGPSVTGNKKNKKSGDNEWMFSYEKFQWAFAMVNSRHWQLPIEDLEATNRHQPTDESEASPPASSPTESWVKQNRGEKVDYKVRELERQAISGDSFLAPVADLLNFGPPCTRGSYDKDSQNFEIIASCSFQKGQEVTFWYSDECDHVMVGVYGFTHPIVPPCPTAEEHRRNSIEWKARAEALEEQLRNSKEELQYIYSELEEVENILDSCDCCGYVKSSDTEKKGRREEARTQTRGARKNNKVTNDIQMHGQRHGVRQRWRDGNSRLRDDSEF